MRKISVSIILATVLLFGCTAKVSGKEMTGYLENLGFEVESYLGSQEVTSEDALYESIQAVQYEEIKLNPITVHNYKTEVAQVSLIIANNEIIGGYKTDDKGYIYSLDGKLADVTGLYNN